MKLTVRNIDAGTRDAGLTVSAIAFLLGSATACICAKYVAGDGLDSLSAYVLNYIDVLKAGSFIRPGFFTVVFDVLKYAALIFVAGFSFLGVAAVPIIMAMRGFFLCFSISAFVIAFGYAGFTIALAVFGLSSLIILPCLFALAARSFSSARVLLGTLRDKSSGGGQAFDRAFFLNALICLGFLLMAVFLEYLITPLLISAVTSVVI